MIATDLDGWERMQIVYALAFADTSPTCDDDDPDSSRDAAQAEDAYDARRERNREERDQ